MLLNVKEQSNMPNGAHICSYTERVLGDPDLAFETDQITSA